jgi:outer membrane protein OmpA-like peptidoglycan-associated protein
MLKRPGKALYNILNMIFFIRYVRYALLFTVVIHCNEAIAQLKIDTTVSIEKLVNSYFLTGTIKAFNIRYKGSKYAIGLFTNDSGSFNINKGIVLSTGRATAAKGPNNSKRGGVDLNTNYRPDKDLDKIARGQLLDQATLEFDFIPVSDSISFKYVFGSEEYPEYVNSQFNDVFAFFVNGPGIKGARNIAVLPGTQVPITINTINQKTNSRYFVNNYYYLNPKTWKPFGKYRRKKYADMVRHAIQYDGYTTVLYAKTKVSPYQVYHIKIIIADVADNFYDSGVFLQANSFISYARNDDTTTNKPVVMHQPQKPEHKDSVLTTITLHIKFAFDSDKIPDSSFNDLNTICRVLREAPRTKVEIYGHTDSLGSFEYNENLSNRRAHAVACYMENCGIDKNRIVSSGKGKTEPIATNLTTEGRAENRRVVFVIRKE